MTDLTRRRMLATGLGLAALPVLARPWTAGPARAATRDDAETVAAVERYLNDIRTVRSQFLQVASTGEIARGTFYLHRPGRLRIEYQPPTEILIVGDRHHLIYYDKELESVNYVAVDDTPAALFMEETIRLAGDVTVTGVAEEKGTVRVHLVRSAEPDGGTLTLLLGARPLTLRQWTVADAQGTETRVTLVDPEFGVALDPELFRFTPPEE